MDGTSTKANISQFIPTDVPPGPPTHLTEHESDLMHSKYPHHQLKQVVCYVQYHQCLLWWCMYPFQCPAGFANTLRTRCGQQSTSDKKPVFILEIAELCAPQIQECASKVGGDICAKSGLEEPSYLSDKLHAGPNK
jgi:hypothetical protein